MLGAEFGVRMLSAENFRQCESTVLQKLLANRYSPLAAVFGLAGASPPVFPCPLSHVPFNGHHRTS